MERKDKIIKVIVFVSNFEGKKCKIPFLICGGDFCQCKFLSKSKSNGLREIMSGASTPDFDQDQNADHYYVVLDSVKNIKDDDESQNSCFQKHPLLTDVISSEVSAYLDFKSLKNYRQVCKAWNSTCFGSFEAKTQIRAEFDEIEKSISEFVKIYTKAVNAGRVYRKIKFRTPGHLDCPILVKWMELFGSNLFSIQLGCCEEPPPLVTNTNLLQIRTTTLYLILVNWCTNLKELLLPNPNLYKDERPLYSIFDSKFVIPVVKLKNLVIGSENSGQNSVVPFDRLFTVVHTQLVYTVENIELISRDHWTFDFPLEFWLRFPMFQAEMNVRMKSLRSLKLSKFALHSDVLEDLGRYTFDNLKELELGGFYKGTVDTTEHIHNFMMVVKSTLESLSLLTHSIRENKVDNACQHLTRRMCPTIERRTFSELTALKKLEITLPRWNVGNLDDLITSLPNLESLIVYTNESIEMREFKLFIGRVDVCQTVHKNLKRLRFVNKSLYINARMVQKIVDKSLCFNARMVQKIVDSFPELERLTLGIENMELVDKLVKFKKLQKLNVETDLNGYGVLRNMKRFKALRVLRFAVYHEDPVLSEMLSLNIDDLLSGFLAAPALTHLSLFGFKMTEEVYNLLHSKDLKVQTKLSSSIVVVP